MSDLEWVNGSMREAIADLPIGDSYAKTRRYDVGGITKEQATQKIGSMRNTLNSAMRRAMDDTGFKYTLETGMLVTQSGGLLLIAAVTRME